MAEAPAFATAADLAGRLGIEMWTGLELARVNLLLGDASAHLREIIGWQVWPAAAVTTRVPPYTGEPLRLPGSPITGITSVVPVGGTQLPSSAYEVIDGELTFGWSWPQGAAVTYTVGYGGATAPRDLVSWTCVLASQALSVLEELGSLGAGGVSGIAIDDFRKNWAQGGDGAGFVLPARVEDKLRQQYGTGAYVTGRS